MECPECESTHVNKNARKRGKQNYICVDCQRRFLDHYQIPRGYSDKFKRECLTLYVNGMGFRAQGARVKGINHVTVINWVKQGELLPNAYDPEATPQVGELDELETFIGSKKNQIWRSGCRRKRR